MQWLMYWLEILPGRSFGFHLSFCYSPEGNYRVQCEKSIYLTRIPFCVVTSGSYCLLRCRDQLSESMSWWKTLRIKDYLSLPAMLKTHTGLVSSRKIYTVQLELVYCRRLRIKIEINCVICSFLGLCLCYPTDTLRDWTSLATGTGFKNTVKSQMFEVSDSISFHF